MATKRVWTINCCVLITTTALYSPIDGFSLRRLRRDTDSPQPVGSFSLPTAVNTNPFPSIGSDNMAPNFPFTHAFTNALDINFGNVIEQNAHLNVPVPGWGMWNMKAHQLVGPTHTFFNYGHFMNPADPLKLGPQTMAQMGQDATARAAMARDSGSPGIQSVPVMHMPADFIPAQCKPPMCNPFFSSFGAGISEGNGAAEQYEGSIDFPYQAKNGTIQRFPLSGDFIMGYQPRTLVYSQGMNPVNPFKSLDNSRQKQQNQQAQQSTSKSNTQSSSSASANFQPFVLPTSNFANPGNRQSEQSYYRGNRGLVLPPAIPATPNRDSPISPSQAMPRFPLIVGQSGNGRRI